MSQLDWFVRASLKSRHLQLLVAVDDQRHLGRVADSLHVSQPAVSLALGELEKGLGMKLFERTPKGLVPNAFGECAIRHARAVLSQLGLMREELHALLAGSAGKVHIGALPATTPGLLPAAIAQFKTRHPQTSLSIQEGSMEVLLPELRRGGLDLIVGRLLDRSKPDDLSEESLYDGTNVLVVDRRHALAGSKRLKWQDLMAYPWVMPPPGSLSREPMEQMLQQHRCDWPSDCVETLSIPVIVQYLQIKPAIGMMSQAVARHYVEQGMLHQLPLKLPDPKRPIGITWNRHRPMSPAAQDLVRALRQIAKTPSLA